MVVYWEFLALTFETKVTVVYIGHTGTSPAFQEEVQGVKAGAMY